MAHHTDGSSIQQHSAGPAYPFVVYSTEAGTGVLHPDGREELVYMFTHHTPDDRMAGYATASERAYSLAQARRRVA